MPHRALAVPFAAVLFACVEPAPETEAAFAPPQCPISFCGNNPTLGADPFWELDESRVSFSPMGKFRIVKLVKNGVTMQPQVDGFVLTALDGNGVTHPAIGGVMHVESEGGKLFHVTIAQGIPMPFYEGGHPPGTPLLPTYRTTYVEVVNGKPGPVRDLCVRNVPTVPRDALVFQGDRYDYIGGEVSAIGDSALPWFNIACKDDSLWKLALMRHVHAAQGVTSFLTSKNDRTAGLRSIRADYCGTGTSHTAPNTAVDWSNRGGWLTIDEGANPELEAYWDEKGAICVDKPRLVDRDTILCAPKWCDEVTSAAKQAALFRTQVP